MTNKERYKQAFSALHTSAEIVLEVDDMKKDKKQKHFYKIAIVAAAVVACFMGANGICYAQTGQSLVKRIVEFRLANGVEIEMEEGTEGDEEYVSMNMTAAGDVDSYTLVENDRLYFVLDNVKTDITDECDTESYYRYDYTDEKGLNHVIIIGGTIDNCGWAEYVFDAEGNYITNLMEIPGDDYSPAWLLNAEHSLGVPTGEAE